MWRKQQDLCSTSASSHGVISDASANYSGESREEAAGNGTAVNADSNVKQGQQVKEVSGCSVGFSYEKRSEASKNTIAMDADFHNKGVTQPYMETSSDIDSDSEDSCSGSVFSLQRFKVPSISSMPQNPVLKEAKDTLIPLIVNHPELTPLYHEALQNMTVLRFERSFLQLWRQYCSDLAAEADNVPEKEMVKMLKISAHQIVHTVREHCLPLHIMTPRSLVQLKTEEIKKHKDMERSLRQVNGDTEGKEDLAVDEVSDDYSDPADSDPEDEQIPEHFFLNVRHIKTFLISSAPFKRFHENLRVFVHRNTKAKRFKENAINQSHGVISQEPGDKRNSTYLMRFLAILCRKLQPPLPQNHQRITWTCVSELSFRHIVPPLYSLTMFRVVASPCIQMLRNRIREVPSHCKRLFERPLVL